MRSNHFFYFGVALFAFLFSACEKEKSTTTDMAEVKFAFQFDPNQERLNNFGQPATMPAGNAGQNPDFKGMSVHYLELAPSVSTQLGKGVVLYSGAETSAGGEKAIDFSKAVVSDGSSPFFSLKLSEVPPGTYEWLRASVTFQTYDIRFNLLNVPILGDLIQQKGRVASFVGYNTFIGDLKLREKNLAVNDDKKQGFWAFETELSPQFSAYNQVSSGQAPAGATTVVNPLFSSSPVPAGSCVVTGKFEKPLVITGKETDDISVKVSFSVNHSFEWKDVNGNKQWDIYADNPSKTEQVVDMGLRGLKVSY